MLDLRSRTARCRSQHRQITSVGACNRRQRIDLILQLTSWLHITTNPHPSLGRAQVYRRGRESTAPSRTPPRRAAGRAGVAGRASGGGSRRCASTSRPPAARERRGAHGLGEPSVKPRAMSAWCSGAALLSGGAPDTFSARGILACQKARSDEPREPLALVVWRATRTDQYEIGRMHTRGDRARPGADRSWC